jgi:hypothetical protein
MTTQTHTIQTGYFQNITCDGCGEFWGSSIASDEQTIEHVRESGWGASGDEHLCPDCADCIP